MAHVLVTGGCGFFGSWIAQKLLHSGHRVTVIDLERVTKRWEMILSPEEIERIAFVTCRIDEPEGVKDTFTRVQPDAVIHLAGMQVPGCRSNPILGARVNVIGTLAIFEAAAALAKKPPVIYASSAAVFGSDADYDSGAVGDASLPLPGTHYGAFKLCTEHCGRVYFSEKRIRSVGLRPLTVYGPGRDAGMTSFPTRAVAAAILKQKFDIPFSGPTTYTFAEEIADLFTAAALNPPEAARVYTVGGDVLDTPAFIAELEKALPGARTFVTCSGGPLPVASRMDDAELRRAFPNVRRIGITEGLATTINVFKRLAERGRLEV
ncbi:MAG TPA: NAD-dependent epimerase/dehydratase family protein [Planctomycetota bacterium]|nr:NAD-dependent epimerase/dehydratase family protein [Planctomycetota bacterium]